MRAVGFLFAVVVALVLALPADAQITKLKNDSYVNGVVAGTVTNDLYIDFAGTYTGMQIRVQLTQGSIYQSPIVASAGAPTAGLVSAIPEVAFDTYLAKGSPTADGPFGNPSPGGGAVNLGGMRESLFDDEINISSMNLPFGGVDDQSDFLTARVTLSDDAQGTWSYLASADRVFGVVENLPINGGVMRLPPNGDYDIDGQTGGGDLDAVLLNWGEDVPPVPSGWYYEQPALGTKIGQEQLDGVLLHWGDQEGETVPHQIDGRDFVGTETGLTGDFNGNGKVEQADLDLLILNLGPYDGEPIEGWVNDLPTEGSISCCDEGDRLLLNWGNELPPSGGFTAVPEPASIVLLATGFAGICATQTLGITTRSPAPDWKRE